ncbi:ATP-binding protein [Pseudoroseicyclus sp. CXY001]|uniref:hybrid sensor histidine kinase/response regulator n=1 Tax=Pseudoroseicyclus sp. CXY001 TaxID=3242492 RepID=UPI0035712A02
MNDSKVIDVRQSEQIAAQPGRDPASGRGTLQANRGVLLLCLAAAAIAAAWTVLPQPISTWATFAAGALFAAALLVAAGALLRRRGLARVVTTLGEAFEGDETAMMISDREGRILTANLQARARHRGAEPPARLGDVFDELLASSGEMLAQMQERAEALGGAREEVVTRRDHLKVTVSRIASGAFLWRLEDVSGSPGGRAAEAVSLPMITAAASGTILFMNEPARKLAGGRVRSLSRLFEELPLQSGRLHTVRAAEGPVSCLVAEVKGLAGRTEIYLLPAGAADPERRGVGWDAIEDLPVPLLKVSRAGQVLASTREARELLPTPVGPRTLFSDLVEGLGRPVIDWVEEVFEGRGPQGPQFLKSVGGGDERFLQIWLNLAGAGEDPHVVVVLSDVTELESLKEQFNQSQKMQAVGQLAGGVAHDFNNLLTAISGHCDLLLLKHDEGDADYADLIQIHQNANRAAALVSQLLAFSRKQNLMPEVIDLRDTLSDLGHLLGRLVGEKVTLTLNHDPDLRPIRADRRQLEQVLVNLVVNARDAMPDGGEIRLETENRTLRQPLVRDRATVVAGDWVVIRVTDEGMGIPPEKSAKIFEPFFTTKRPGEGTGLGLSTAYGIVKQTGGFIFVDSEPGEGATFSIWLPAHRGKAPAAVPRPPKRLALPDESEHGVVLLVEDEAPVRAFASRALRMRGYTVLEADSAEAALDLLDDPDLSVDIFVTDVIMPGKDGPTWVREALRARPDTRVVFVSGYAEDSFAEHKALIPNSVFLAKPFSLADLTDKVQQQLQ